MIDMTPGKVHGKIIGILRQHEAGGEAANCAVSAGSAVQLSANGNPITGRYENADNAARKAPISVGSRISSRMVDDSVCWQRPIVACCSRPYGGEDLAQLEDY